MRTSELIEQLKKVKQYHGDQDLLVSTSDGYLHQVSSVSTEEIECYPHIIINVR